MLRIAEDALGDWAERVPGAGLFLMTVASTALWGIVAGVVLIWF